MREGAVSEKQGLLCRKTILPQLVQAALGDQSAGKGWEAQLARWISGLQRGSRGYGLWHNLDKTGAGGRHA